MRGLHDILATLLAVVAPHHRHRRAPEASIEKTPYDDALRLGFDVERFDPSRARAADTDHEYIFPFSNYSGRAGSILPALRAQEELRFGEVRSPTPASTAPRRTRRKRRRSH